MAGRIAYTGGIVRDGLVLLLDAAKKDSYPGSGTTWRDLSGNENNGTLTNGPTFNSDNNGSIAFDGVNDFNNFGTIFNFTSEPFTFSYWINFNSLTTNQAGQGPIVLWKGNFSTNGYYDQISTTGGITFITNQGGAYQVSNTNTGVITAGTWCNISYTRNGSSVRISLNGTDITQTTGIHINPATTTNNFRIAVYNTNQIYGNFRLSQFSTYNRALSATEITQNFNALRGRYNI